MANTFSTYCPGDGALLCERAYTTDEQVSDAIDAAVAAQQAWRKVPLAERIAIIERCVDAFVARKDAIAEEIARQMGRPVRFGGGEVLGLRQRALYMTGIAKDALADMQVEQQEGFVRFIRREPLGVVAVLAPWNYPFLTSVNAIVPALLAGNAVILKHAEQTPLVAERWAECLAEAGLPDGLFKHVFLTHGQVATMVANPRIDHVCFTGSVPGGEAVHRATAGRFIAVGLELGGKDPAYVRADADLPHAIESLADGAMFNSGQSCCGVERIYVHADVYDAFVAGVVAEVNKLKLGDPLDPESTLGPMVRVRAADFVRQQVADAIAAGATPLIQEADFPASKPGTTYLHPQVLVDVDHSMDVMIEETFGPVVGIMKVADDDEAVALMNDSKFGLTASVWTRDLDVGLALGDRLETGTVFMNRCDYLDPALAWVGVKDSGRGATLSRVGYEHLTRAKSFHMRVTV